MHFIVLKENLDKALSIVSRTLASRPQMPILGSLLFIAKENTLKIYSTNLELGVIYNLSTKIEKEGEVAIPGKLLTEFVSSLQAEKIEFKLEESKLTVSTKGTKATFTTNNPKDFPPFIDIPETQRSLPLEKIKGSITRAALSASIDEARPVLTGIKMTITEESMSLIATDGYRLSKEEITLPGKKSNLEVLIPASSLSEVTRIASEIKTEEIGFSIVESKNQVVFYLPNIYIITRLIDGEFPNTERIIPQGFKTKVLVDKESLAKSVKTASIFARGAANIIKIKVEKDGLRLTANTPQIGEDEGFVEAKVEGEEFEVAFNFRFLLDLLANFPGKEVVFESLGPLSPGVFKPNIKGVNFLHLIMPVRVQS